ncbi:flavin reductase family protein [Lyngbya confervoides]|uniref:Flavin reductase family protein n=1 Tax=Lyngbya confervoides BDU141951 TaxID=1574623 RepID=A0ABD4T551_9CYAN|nr:flavin reductase [Lyngbya confervoides]MCM1983644.1 flavin reductase family protein [Lyngbya confervoides BDU141951]
MDALPHPRLISLDLNQVIWEQVFLAAPLVIIGTRSTEGRYDLAPKHMAMPLGWGNYFGFVCTPRHQTFRNIQREGVFTVSYPSPDQVLQTSLAAGPRTGEHLKPTLEALPTIPATTVEGLFLQDAYFYLECRLDRIVEGFGEYGLIVGQIVAAHGNPDLMRGVDRDDQDLIHEFPLLVYLCPGRYARVDQSFSFPFHTGFQQ